MASVEPGPRTSKLLGLEIVRFGCAIAVLLWHYGDFALVGDAALAAGPHVPFGSALSLFYDFGKFGVQFFWCISGFIFYWKYADALAERRVSAKRFFWLRVSRLYPLHLVTLLFVAAVQPLYAAMADHWFVFEGTPSEFVLQLFMANQWGGIQTRSFNGPIWSVSAEVLVYVAFFVLVRRFGKSPWLIAGPVAAGAACLLLEATSPTVICGAYFFAGGAAALVAGGGRASAGRRGALLLLVAGLLAAPLLHLGSADEIALGLWLLAMVPSILVVAAREWAVLDRWQAPILAAGNLTYSTYLVQFPMQLTVVTIALATHIALPVGQAWFLLAYLASALLLGRIIFVRFEAPAQAAIRSLILDREGTPALA